MKRSLIIVFVIPVVFSLLLTGCIFSRERFEEKNEELHEVIEVMSDEIRELKDKSGKLITEAEDNWKQLQECIDEKKTEQKELITVSAENSAPDTAGWTVLDKSEYDFTGDGKAETISLLTSAVKDESGNIMWDDGQYFLLLVQNGGEYYTLLDERVQIGRVYFSVFEDDEPGVIITVSTFAGIRLEQYAFDSSEDKFTGSIAYDSADINIIYSTMPWD